MKITIEKDDGKREVFQDVTDYALVVRQWVPVVVDEQAARILRTCSFSHDTGGLREVLKEMRQAVPELDRLIAQRQEQAQRQDAGP